MKKELLVLALCAVLFSGCGAGADSSSEKSVEKVSSVQTTAPQAEKESTLPDVADKVSDIDTSESFSSFDELAGSEKVKGYLEKAGADKLSAPVISDKMSQTGEITLYDNCFYVSYADQDTLDSEQPVVVTVCFSFDKVNDLDGMTAFFEEFMGDGAFSTGSFEADSENGVVVNKGNHVSLYRASADGLLYCIFSEGLSEEEIYGYLDAVIF